ncbi:cytoplasmic protein [Rickenella mellea]|uniref:Cytoplasmic protein n=1 Tax=Rickenella mellea TaxID=50990 RepID=A0A4Y7QD91_9AGAM|nr:cytoplasmic protein [Rickenella mellea]
MATTGEISDVLTNLARPKTSATLTIRIIKSFEFRTERSLVLHDVNLETTSVKDLKEQVLQVVQTESRWKPYRNTVLDTLKIYTQAHGAKTTNLIINLDNDDWFLDDDTKLLATVGLDNESEVSFFNRDAYDKFKANPETRWD